MTILRALFACFVMTLCWTPAQAQNSDGEFECATLRIEATLPGPRTDFKVWGQGWLVENNTSQMKSVRQWVLVPAHVIALAKSLSTTCHGQTISLQPLAWDNDRDIALVAPVGGAHIAARELFKLSDLMQLEKLQGGFRGRLEKDQIGFHVGTRFFIHAYRGAGAEKAENFSFQSRRFEVLDPQRNTVIGAEKIFSASGIAVPPGWSGSAFYLGSSGVRGEKYFMFNLPSGMVVRTRFNDIETLVLSTWDIQLFAREVLNHGARGAIAGRVSYQIFERDGSFYREKVVRLQNKGLFSNDEVWARDSCAGFELEDVGGGDIGDGGGAIHRSEDLAFYLPEPSSEEGLIATSSYAAVLKNIQPCKGEGVYVQSSGATQLISSFVDPKRGLMPLRSLDDLIFLSKNLGEKHVASELKKLVAKGSSQLSLDRFADRFCAATKLDKGDSIGIDQEKPFLNRNESFSTERNADGSSFQDYRIPLKYISQQKGRFLWDSASVSCYAPQKRFSLLFRDIADFNESRREQFSFALNIVPEKVWGEIKVGTCLLKIEEPRQGAWSHLIDLAQAKVLVQWTTGVGEPLYRVRLLESDPKCFADAQSRPHLIKVEGWLSSWEPQQLSYSR